VVYSDKLETYFSEETNIRSNRIFSVICGLEPGWIGVSFGLRKSYVRIIMTRTMLVKYNKKTVFYISNVLDI
jgi:hypothetical protein